MPLQKRNFLTLAVSQEYFVLARLFCQGYALFQEVHHRWRMRSIWECSNERERERECVCLCVCPWIITGNNVISAHPGISDSDGVTVLTMYRSNTSAKFQIPTWQSVAQVWVCSWTFLLEREHVRLRNFTQIKNYVCHSVLYDLVVTV
jgi:hypothetical protein